MRMKRAQVVANGDRLRHSTACAFIAVVCASLLICAGCTVPHSPPPPLADLHIPGVSKVSQSDRVAQQTGTHQIDTITTYTAADEGHTARILALVGERVFDIGVDGSAFHEIPLPVSCNVALSVTADGQWGACQSDDGIEVFGLSGESTGRSSEVIQNPKGEVLRTPSWAPDGRHLAAASRLDGGAVNIYTVSPAYDSLQLTARLTFEFAYVDSVSWSADGEWLAVDGGSAFGGFTPYLVHIGPLWPQLFGHEDAPVTIRVGHSLISDANGSSPIAWMPAMSTTHTATVTFASDGDRRIVQQNLATGRLATLLTQQVGYICGLVWTPDDTKLIFALCVPNTTEYSDPPTVLYTYTPPN